MAARSVHVQFNVESLPDTKFVLVSSAVTDGEWSAGLQPPSSLTPPQTSIVWQSEDDGFLTGTQGWVRYYPVTPGGSVPANVPDEDTIYMTWDDPYAGENSYASSAPAPYKISGGSILNFSADNDEAVFTLTFTPQYLLSINEPALTSFAPGPLGSQIVMAYIAANGSNGIFIATTDSASTWGSGSSLPDQSSLWAPAITECNGEVVVVYVAANATNQMLVANSKDAVNWSGPTLVGGQSTSQVPAIASAGGTLVIAYISNNPSHNILVTTSPNGINNWDSSNFVTGNLQSYCSPALAVIGNTIYMAYVAADGTNDLYIVTSTNQGGSWSAPMPVTGQTSQLGPALANFGGDLVMVYLGNTTSQLYATTSKDGGKTWPIVYPITNQTTTRSPTLAVLGNSLVLAYLANNPGDRMIISTTTNADNNAWSIGNEISGV